MKVNRSFTLQLDRAESATKLKYHQSISSYVSPFHCDEKGFTEIKCDFKASGTLEDNQVTRLLPNPVWEHSSSVQTADDKPTLVIVYGSSVI